MNLIEQGDLTLNISSQASCWDQHVDIGNRLREQTLCPMLVMLPGFAFMVVRFL